MSLFDNGWSLHLKKQADADARARAQQEAAAEQRRLTQQTEAARQQQAVNNAAQQALHEFTTKGNVNVYISRSVDKHALENQLNSQLNQHGYKATVEERTSSEWCKLGNYRETSSWQSVSIAKSDSGGNNSGRTVTCTYDDGIRKDFNF